MPEASPQILDPAAREAIKRLELEVREIVAGLRSGGHRSKRKGVSSDFLHHKGYQAGDPLKFIDWKVFARTRKLYVREFIEDSTMNVWVVLDGSGSMSPEPERYLTEQGYVDLPSKYAVGRKAGAVFAALAISQQDAAGLIISGSREGLRKPMTSQRHLSEMMMAMVAHTPSGAGDLAGALRAVEEAAKGPGMVVVVSDFMFDPEPVRRRMKTLRGRGHDVMMIQVESPTEQELPMNRWVDFRDAESAEVRHKLDATLLRTLYQEEVEAFEAEWADFARRQRVDRLRLRTDGDLMSAVRTFLRQRMEG